GGLMDFAYAYIVGNQGIHTDADYPYLMEEGDCKEKQVGTCGTGNNKLTNSSDEIQLQTHFCYSNNSGH
uniref:Peptidase C1A papain C-terminal domain-containing protein n=1 Tax=Aegilops tauschii subsp. strangulata TaxID=200361 RepID=A0A453PEN9_AEGTS